MSPKRITSYAFVFLAGALAASIFSQVVSKVPPAPVSAGADVHPPAQTDDLAALRADYERRIADLTTQLEASRSRPAGMPGTASALARNSVLEEMKVRQEEHQDLLDGMQDSDTRKLLDAGFTMDRIAWIRGRAEVLTTEFRRKQDQLEQSGVAPNFEEAMAHSYDSDIDLRRELGDEEYTRYRQALGRPIGTGISGVMQNGPGFNAGIREGDQIVSYNNTRVFNLGELNAQIRQYAAGSATLPIVVMRNGQKVALNVPSGSLGIRSPPPVRSTQDQLQMREMVEGVRNALIRNMEAAKMGPKSN